eukprot:TRINITY_DN2287_c0_g1_i2.p1 TRINITY_DN2287_c0_g1~~TRINITY_DN2287_c0_g1_i2.p1  ORF type:complete len:295 (-),score=40.66 TRINITY_DN2287_c0_g1_i2:97-981(-)
MIDNLLDMYGVILVESTAPGGDIGVLFMHNKGYSTMCGHGIIAVTTALYETGVFTLEKSRLNIDAPAGRIVARVNHDHGTIKSISFENVASFTLYQNLVIDIPYNGNDSLTIKYDVAYGGAFYAFVDIDDECNIALGLTIDASQTAELIHYGKLIKRIVMETVDIHHPCEPDLSFLYGVIFTSGQNCISTYTVNDIRSSNVCIFANGQLDRCPTGTGVSARCALEYTKGRLVPGKRLCVESIVGSVFRGEISRVVDYEGYNAVVPIITGDAFITGRSQFWLDPKDYLKEGFLLR